MRRWAGGEPANPVVGRPARMLDPGHLVIVPNSRFAETVLTNHHEPQPAVNVFLPCRVSYQSDLQLV